MRVMKVICDICALFNGPYGLLTKVTEESVYFIDIKAICDTCLTCTLFLSSSMAVPWNRNFTMAVTFKNTHTINENEHDQEHDESASAAVVAAEIISSARLALKLDSVYTEYSAQYLVNNARPKKKGGHKKKKMGGIKTLTVKRCLEYALKNGIPIEEDWPPLGFVSKPLPSYKPPLVSMDGEVIEGVNMTEAQNLSMEMDHVVGAKLHVFSPQIDLEPDGIYYGPSKEDGGYVGLRDGIIVRVERMDGKSVATVKLWYKQKFRFVKVAMSRMFALGNASPNGDSSLNCSRGVAPTLLLVDFCVLRLSIN